MSSKLAQFLALDKVANLFRIIQQNGGVTGCMSKIFRQDDLKYGELVGEDKFGNKYYENNRYFYGRNRWVEYHPRYHLNYDASLVPPEWFGWLHYKTDALPHNIQDDPADLHGVSQPAISKTCEKVAEVLSQMSRRFIKTPATIHEQEETIRKFRSIAGFPTVIGAIDCTHIKVKKYNTNEGQLFINRKGFPSINVQDPHRPHYPWMLDHTENLSGTTGQYVPYSTTRPKIEAWVPQQKESK